MTGATHFPPIPISSDLERRALAIWNRKQAEFPTFVRRPPDTMDLATGLWAKCLAEAVAEGGEQMGLGL